MKKRTALAENVLRQYIRKEIHKLMEADKEEGEEVEKVEKEPEVQPEEEQGLNPDHQQALSLYLRKLQSSTASVDGEALIDMVSTIIDTFTTSSEERLNILKAVKSNIVK